MPYFDDNEDRIIYGRRRSFNEDVDLDDQEDECQPLKCNRCGSADVRWRQQSGKWVLFSLQPGVEHRCPIPDGFDVVPE